MKFFNKISYCKITFPHKGEMDFTKALNLPIIFNPVLDETLNTAQIVLSDMRQNDYPNINISKAFEAFTKVKIGFVGQKTVLQMVIAHDDTKMKRKDDSPWKSWTHTIQLVEETKQLERESVDVLTFTNPVERKYDSKADAEWWIIESSVRGLFIDNSNVLLNGWDLPKGFKMFYKRGTKLSFNNNSDKFEESYVNETVHGQHIYSYKKINYLNIYVTEPTGKSYLLEPDSAGNVSVVFDTNGEYIIKIDFQWEEYVQNTVSTQNFYTYTFETYIAAGDIENLINNYTIKEVLNRTLAVTPLRTKSEPPKYKFDAAQLEEYSQEESPEFAFTGHTLFEAMLQISGYKGAFPELRTTDEDERIISFRPLWNGVFKTAADLPDPIDETNCSDINQYCTYLETEVQNLVGLNDSRKATLIEPYAGGYKTTRSGADSEISEDTVIIPTDYNIYQSIDLNMGYTNGATVGPITPYVYEQGEYEGLSDTNGAYPNSKAFAIKWTQMGRNYTELAHRIFKVDTLSNAWQRPAISNILYARTGISGESSLMTYLAKLVGVKDKDTFAELMFRSEYVPIFNARVKQYKDYFGEFHHDGSIKYNQTAELVDSEMYGEHLKQLIRKIGNATKRCVYIFDKIDDVPEVGTVVDGYSVYDVQMSIRENEVVATIFYVKYAELSPYIGVKNAWKDSDVSTNKCYNRAISYNEFLLFSHDGAKNGTSSAVKPDMLRYLANFKNARPLTCVKATGHYIDGTPLNTVLLPLISLAMGNSLFFTWKYEDNYSAGYMSETAPTGATNAISGTKYNRAQKAVRYCDMYGRLETYDFALMPSGPIANGVTGWRKNDDEITYNGDYVSRQIGYSLPLLSDNIVGWNCEEYFSVSDLDVQKNSSEALTFSVQLHYCTDNENFIVGSGVTNFSSPIGGQAQSVYLYGFADRLNIFKRRIDVDTLERNGKAHNLGSVNFSYNNAQNRLQADLPFDINGYNAWALMGKDINGNWQIIFGENRDLKGSDFKTELYLLPMHKLEDFI